MARSKLERLVWNLQRFGLSPCKIRWRMFPPDASPIFVQSIPKSGTHLVERALCLHKPIHRRILPTLEDHNLPRWGGWVEILRSTHFGQVLVGHVTYSAERARALEERGFRSLFVIRNPRDLVVSDCKYIARSTKHRRHRLYHSQPDLESQMRLNIEGLESEDLPPLRTRLGRYMGWTETDALLVRFEDLIGEAGGGDEETQFRMLERIHEHCRTGANAEDLVRICRRLFSSASPTFRKGQIGQWKVHFDNDLSQLFENRVGDLAATLGYGGDDVS